MREKNRKKKGRNRNQKLWNNAYKLIKIESGVCVKMEARGILIKIMNKILVCLCRERFDFSFLLRLLLKVSTIKKGMGRQGLMTRCSLQFHTHKDEKLNLEIRFFR